MLYDSSAPAADRDAPSQRLMDQEAFRRALRRITLRPIFALGSTVLLLVVLACWLLRAARQVEHTDHVIAQTENVQRLAVDMETGLRGFRVSSDEVFLQPFYAARTKIEGELDGLVALVSDNPAQTAAASTLRAQVNTWRTWAERSLAQERVDGAASRTLASLLEGKTMMDGIRKRVDAIVVTEHGLRDIRNRRVSWAVTGLFGLLGLSALLGIPAMVASLRRWLSQVAGDYQKNLLASERYGDQLSVTLRSIGDGVIATDAAGAVSFLNPVAERLTGWKIADARGRPLAEVFDIFNEQTGEKTGNPVERVLREKIIVGLANHTVLRIRGGGEVPIEDSAAPIIGGDGEVRGVILVFHDVTEKRERERRLRETEMLKSAIVDASLDAFILMDHEGRIVDWNASAELMFNRPRAQAIGLMLGDTIVPERLREAHRQGLARYVATREARILGRRYELPAIRGDGAEFMSEISITHVPGTEPPLFAGYVRDISERKNTERELQERAKLSTLRADISLAVAGSDDTCNYQACCEHFVVHLGVAFARIWILDGAGTTLELRASAGLYTHLDGPHARVPVGEFKIGRIAKSKQAHLTNDVPHDPNISNPEWAQREGMIAFAGYPLLVEGEVLGVLGMFSKEALSPEALTDLAPIADSIAQCALRKQTERALRVAKDTAEAASQAKDNFLAALSHELRTPLTPVLMAASALREDETLPEPVREQLGMIERNVALEARLIDDLLDLTRIARGKLAMRLERCDAHSLIGFAVDIVRDEAREKQITLELSLDANRSSVTGDPARLQQLFWNLLRNAVKFTPAGGRVTIRSRDAESPGDGADVSSWLHIEVTDTGVGVPPEMVEKIFEPFEQAGTEKHQYGGLGLGLAIARAIAGMHGGMVHAESEGTGRGTTFVVDLPGSMLPSAESAPAGGGGEIPTEAGGEGGSRLRLLLVEDHQPTLLVLARLLTRDGHEVVTADTIHSALSAARAGTFDGVISDLGLPDGTGIELMEKLRERHGLRGVALSGYGMDEDLRRSSEAGFLAHLVKPVDFQQFRRALRHFTRREE